MSYIQNDDEEEDEEQRGEAGARRGEKEKIRIRRKIMSKNIKIKI